MLALLLAASAVAHRPHTPVTALAVDPGLEEAWLAFESAEATQIMRSLDLGRHWDAVVSPAKDDAIVGAALRDGTLVFLGEDGTAHWTADQGDSWASVELGSQAGAIAATDDAYLIGTSEGVVRWVPGRTPLPPLATPGLVSSLAEDDGDIWLTTLGGGVFVHRADGLHEMTPDSGDGTGLAIAGDRVYVGTHDGLLTRLLDGTTSWQACAPLPVTSDGEYAGAVSRVAASTDGQTVFVGTGQQGAVTHDACMTWELLDLQMQTIVYGEVGSASSILDAFRGVWIAGDHAIVAGWEGVRWTADLGEPWNTAPIEPEDYYRGLDFAPNFPDDPRLFVGGYGGGPRFTRDGGATWRGTSAGTVGLYAFDVALHPAADLVLYSGSHVLHTSDDSGWWWVYETDGPPMDRINFIEVLGHRVYALGGHDDEGGAVYVSDDFGTSWTSLEIDGDDNPNGVLHARIHGETRLLMTTSQDATVQLREDDAWRVLFDAGAAHVGGLAPWPLHDAFRLILSVRDEGLVLSDDLGVTWRAPAKPPTDPPQHLVGADDGSLFALSRIGQLSRSDDGGETWGEVAAPLAPAVWRLHPAPGFESLGIVLAATHGGLYWWRQGDGWTAAPRQLRLEDRTTHLTCTTATGSDCATFEAKLAGNWGGYAVSEGDVLRFTFRGEVFRVVGEGLQGEAELVVNEESHGIIELGAKAHELGPTGWYDVALHVVSPGPIEVDRIAAEAPGTPIPMPPGGSSAGGTGCQGGSAVLLLFVMSTRRRRRCVMGRAP